jgi:c-di-GMP-binding flagellar brake protein YcgR
MKNEEPKPQPRYGIVNFERRKFPRFSVDLPVEYEKTNSFVPARRVLNVSEGGLLIYFSERMEIGEHLRLRLFFSGIGSDLSAIEALVEVVWIEIDADKEVVDYRVGVKFIYITQTDMNSLKTFLLNLSQPPFVRS